jgi:hypothetical protein
MIKMLCAVALTLIAIIERPGNDRCKTKNAYWSRRPKRRSRPHPNAKSARECDGQSKARPVDRDRQRRRAVQEARPRARFDAMCRRARSRGYRTDGTINRHFISALAKQSVS